MPRAYRLGKRSADKAATRARVVQAAIELYIERGMSRASMNMIARRADVAVATVLNHFPTRLELDRAIVERAQAEMPVPEISVFDGADTVTERVRRLSQQSGLFLERAEPWYRMWLREPMTTGPWAQAGADAGAGWDRLCRFALGPLADDQEAMAILRATMEPGFFNSVRSTVGSTVEAADLIAAAIGPWLEKKADAKPR